MALSLATASDGATQDPAAGRQAFLRAVQDLRAGRMPAACAGLEQALAADPGSIEARFYYGQCLYHLGRLDAAALQLGQVARAEPAMPATHYYLGRLAYDRRRLAEAFEQLRQADSLDPGLPMVHYYLGLVYQAHAQPYAAQLEFGKALDLDPHLGLAAFSLAWVQFHSYGQAAAARASLRKALLANPDAALRHRIDELRKVLPPD
jgi:tetratricopeptide (TPR) repeat protein